MKNEGAGDTVTELERFSSSMVVRGLLGRGGGGGGYKEMMAAGWRWGGGGVISLITKSQVLTNYSR